MSHKQLAFIVLFLLGFLVGIFVSPLLIKEREYGPFGFGMMGGWGGGMMAGQNIDRHFIEQMIPHHQGAIEMAELALENSEHEEIKSLAESIIEAQTLEINNMKEWYKDWFGADVPEGQVFWEKRRGGGMGTHMMMEVGGDIELLSMATENKDFDLEFIRQMIPHHEMAIMMAGMLEATTERKEMKELADQIITSQSQEIEMMESWYEKWIEVPS